MRATNTRVWFTGSMLAVLTVILVGVAWAAPLSQPKEKPILTVAGMIGVTNKDGTAQFDREMLESLGMVSFETTTPWFQGKVKFEGVPLRKLMETVDAKGSRIVAVALNDYSAELPMSDAKSFNVILALKRDGEYMPIRDKGPLFIVYPFDSDTELKSQKYYSRSVWQVARIEIK